MELLFWLFIAWVLWRLLKAFFSSASSNTKPSSAGHRPGITTAATRQFDVSTEQKVSRARRRLWIRYKDANGFITQRQIEIHQPRNDEYIVAWCCLRKEPRTFKRSNILAWQVLNERFEGPLPPSLLQKGLQANRYTQSRELTVSEVGRGDTSTRQSTRQFAELTTWIDQELGSRQFICIPAAAILAKWPTAEPGKLRKAETANLAWQLATRGFAFEPDSRFGSPLLRSDAKVILFRLTQVRPLVSPSQAYTSAMLFLHLGSLVALADNHLGDEERQQLEQQVTKTPGLSEAERHRLRAHLCWLVEERPGSNGLKKRLEALPSEVRRTLGQGLIGIAGADGHVGSKEIQMLTNIYALLGLTKDLVYTDVHSLSTGSVPADEPVLVRPAEPPTVRYRLLQPQVQATPESEEFTLDMSKVAVKIHETAAVSNLLRGIFKEEE
ncbi:MAG: TerB family tellurite resistance protein, partial [Terriglobia bacterium]